MLSKQVRKWVAPLTFRLTARFRVQPLTNYGQTTHRRRKLLRLCKNLILAWTLLP